VPDKVQCPCGAAIARADSYQLIFLRKESNEIDILCPNDACYLRELGYVRFHISGDKANFEEATFYPPFVTWNISQIGGETARVALKSHLKEIVTRIVDWQRIATATTSIKE